MTNNHEVLKYDLQSTGFSPAMGGVSRSVVSLEQALHEHAAIRIPGVLTPDECAHCARRLYQQRRRWKSDYDGTQYSFPENYYARVEGGTEREYFFTVDDSVQLMADLFPREQERFLQVIKSLLDVDLVPLKKGWCGPGFVIFPKNEFVAVNNGPIHVDSEGLVDGELYDKDAKACAVILMIQKPETQGGVRVWNINWEPTRGEGQSLRMAEDNYDDGHTIEYEVGEMVVLNSLKPHQILAFDGDTDRITMNAFGSFVGGRWQFWF
jgi:hypothetical protein